MNNIILGMIGIFSGILMFAIGTYKLRRDINNKSKHRNLWKIKGQIGGIVFIILGILALLGVFGR